MFRKRAMLLRGPQITRLIGMAFAAALLAMAAPPNIARAQAKMIPLKIGVMKIAGLTDVYAAQKLGYFAAQGLDVTIVPAVNGQILLTALNAGDLDVSLAIPGTAMQARDRAGFKLVLAMQNEIAHAHGPDQGALMVRSDSPITSVKELTGKKIGYLQLDNQQWAGIQNVLIKHGVDPKSTREIEIPLPQMQAALEHNLVDAVGPLEPFVSIMLNSHRARVISWNYVESVPNQPNGAFWTTETWFAKNPETIKKFKAAMHASIAYLDTHPEARKALVEEFTGLQSEVVANLIPDLWSDHVVRSDWEKVMKMMVTSGLISPALTFEQLVPASAMDARK